MGPGTHRKRANHPLPGRPAQRMIMLPEPHSDPCVAAEAGKPHTHAYFEAAGGLPGGRLWKDPAGYAAGLSVYIIHHRVLGWVYSRKRKMSP